MKLYYSPTSPYARKARIVILECGQSVELQAENVIDHPDSVPNPLNKVPCLVLDDGSTLFDSPVICGYLLAQAGRADESTDWAARRLEAIGDGIMDAAFSLVMETKRPEAQQSDFWKARWQAAILGALDELETTLPEFSGQFGLGEVSLAAALGYLDFRLGHMAWRENRPRLESWFATVAERSSVKETRPPD